MDYEEGSVMDPYLFSGRPKKPNPREQYRPQQYSKPAPPIKVPITKTLNGVTGIFKTFAKVTSPEYQLKKTERQVKHYEAKEKLFEAKERFAEKKQAYDERHPNFFQRIIRDAEVKRKVHLPKYRGGE